MKLEEMRKARWLPVAGIGFGVYVVLCVVLGFIWSHTPNLFSVEEAAKSRAEKQGVQVVTGYVTANTLVEVANALKKKGRNYFLSGGYVTNDITPPGVFMDNMAAWEFGALVQIRDLARALRQDMSRSQSQSLEDPDLAEAEPHFNYDNNSWWLPPTEDELRLGTNHIKAYMRRLSDPSVQDAQFYARADNLRKWLEYVENRLGSLSQHLSASVGRRAINTDLAGDSAAVQATETPLEKDMRTPWLQIDDVFYEAKGTSWALIHFLKAIEVDFKDVLEKKNALVSVKQIIRELEATQATIWSPMILNGDGFGMLANHSLVMANYISRANAAIIDLRELLSQG